jgi:preprotein translocase subunit YajC
MIVIFWFLIIRPQMRQQKEHRNKIAAMKKGDMVVTAGGLIGKLSKSMITMPNWNWLRAFA